MKRKMFAMAAVVAVIAASATIFVSCQKESDAGQEPVMQQVTHQLGCLLLPAEKYMSIELNDSPLSLLKAAPTVLNLTTPPIGNQGSEGSCVAWGTTYAARSISWQASNPASWSTSVNIFSPEYVYNQIKVGDCSEGSYVTDGLSLLKTQGAVPWSIMPYSDVNGCDLYPTTAQKATAAAYKITSYSRVSITSTAIKAALVAGKPVVVGGPVNRAFMYLSGTTVLKSFTGSSLGGHCYCVVGYDDNKQAFKVMNSWGTTWGSNGYGYIGYSYVSKWFQEAYTIN
jgi:C1A family cysteine protease